MGGRADAAQDALAKAIAAQTPVALGVDLHPTPEGDVFPPDLHAVVRHPAVVAQQIARQQGAPVLEVGNGIAYGSYTVNMYNAGYINTTNAIDEISFKFDSGNIDAGTIYMYGVS